MATLIEQMQAVLSPLASGGSWYANNTAQSPAYPYIVFLRVVSPTNVSFDGASDVQNTLFQIDIFSQRAGEANAIEVALEAALAAAPFTAIQLDQRDGYEDPVRAFRCSVDYSCWSSN